MAHMVDSVLSLTIHPASRRMDRSDTAVKTVPRSRIPTDPRNETPVTGDLNAAAMCIQRIWRGYRIRKNLAGQAQARTPYASPADYRWATNSYAPAVLKKRPFGSALRNAEAGVYFTARDIPSGQRALLHSFQRESDFLNGVKLINRSSKPQIGTKYRPSSYGKHDMRVNAAWLLGLAHFGREIVMTTKLDDQTIIRRSAAKGPQEKRNVRHNLSAYAREVHGLLQNDYFTVQSTIAGCQLLSPTPGVRTATMEGLKTPRGMPKEELRRFFEKKGIDVSGITADSSPSEPADAVVRSQIDDLNGELENIKTELATYQQTWKGHRNAIKARLEDPSSVPDNVLSSLVKANGELMHRAQSLHATFPHGDLDHLPDVADELQSATDTLIDDIAAQAGEIDRLVRKRYPKSRFWNASCFWDKRLRWISVEMDALWERTTSLEKLLASLDNSRPVLYRHFYQQVMEFTKCCHELDKVFDETGVVPGIGKDYGALINEWDALYEKLDELGDKCLDAIESLISEKVMAHADTGVINS
ncbi:hypothetical protein [Noviherbaspirillum saxi]|nr:hypothetical protein [Noviherbaspirillum saxi]